MTKKINQVLIAVIVILLMYMFVDKTKTTNKAEPEQEISTGQVIEMTGELATTGDLLTGVNLSGAVMSGKTLTTGSQDANLLEVYKGIEDAQMHIDNMKLIRKYYSLIEKKDFLAASSVSTTGEASAEKLKKNYSNVKSLRPFKIENITDSLYHFYAVYTESGSTTSSVYSIKKQVVDGKLKTMGLSQIKANTETDHFKYYSDMYLTFTKKVEEFKDLFTADELAADRCPQYGTKTASDFSGVIATLKKQKVAKYNFYFFPTKLFREKNESGDQTKDVGATVYVVPNNGLYKNKEEFMTDFGLCAAGALKPIRINQKYMIFLGACTTGAGEPQNCTEITAMLTASIQMK